MPPGRREADERLRPLERLKGRSEFEAVLREGRRSPGRFMTLVVRESGKPLARLGIVTSKRLGGAAVRNRAKRLIREVFRRCKRVPGAAGRDIIVIPRRDCLAAPFSALESDFRNALRRDERRRGPAAR